LETPSIDIRLEIQCVAGRPRSSISRPPGAIRVDNGSEAVSRDLGNWVFANGVLPAAGFEDTELGCFSKSEEGMSRRHFGREFKREAVHVVVHRGVSVAQAARDLDLHPSLLWRWIRQFEERRDEAFPG
jgi:hypothetical protein